jgi:hypothetical protein
LRRLEFLDASYNQITKVMPVLRHMPSLQTVNIHNNPIEDVPQHIYESSTTLLEYIRSKPAAQELSSPLPIKQPHTYIRLSRGQSITDLILAGSPELAARSSSNSVCHTYQPHNVHDNHSLDACHTIGALLTHHSAVATNHKPDGDIALGFAIVNSCRSLRRIPRGEWPRKHQTHVRSFKPYKFEYWNAASTFAFLLSPPI